MTIVLAVLALVAPPPEEVAAATKATEARALRTTQRSVQKRHKAEVRWRAKRRNAVRPYRGWLARTRACESPTGRDSNNGLYHGYYQFDVRSWYGAGGRGMPCQASRLEQDYRAVIWLRKVGSGAWPVCG